MEKVTENVYVESQISVCNSSIVVTSEGVVVIDTPMVPENARKWAAEAARHGPIKYVINTEPHPDHIAGNCYFGGMLVAHEGTRDTILASKVEEIKGMIQMHSPGAALDKDFRLRPPDITFSERLTLYLGGHTFHLINLPGHTPFQAAVYVPEEKIVFTSDNVNLATPFFRQALPKEWLKSLKKYQKLDVEKVVPGHGPVTDKSSFSKMHKNVSIWINAVAEAIAQGMTVEEVQQKVTMVKQFPDMPRDERTAGVVRMNVARIYETLKK
jgi:glyoxylase-like metal-dependent hydrolase (beta-lactamase superfamily II)